MSEPSKQEREQLAATLRQLERLFKSTDNLYRRMVINGRDQKYGEVAREASELIRQAANVIRVACTETDNDSNI